MWQCTAHGRVVEERKGGKGGGRVGEWEEGKEEENDRERREPQGRREGFREWAGGRKTGSKGARKKQTVRRGKGRSEWG